MVAVLIEAVAVWKLRHIRAPGPPSKFYAFYGHPEKDLINDI